MDISRDEVMAHPLMKQITADIAETRAQQNQARLLQESEQVRLRAEHGQFLKQQYDDAVAEYERLRLHTHEAAGRVWFAVQAYARLTGGTPPPGHSDHVFQEINVPTLIPNPSPWVLSPGIATAKAAIANWYSTNGKEWK